MGALYWQKNGPHLNAKHDRDRAQESIVYAS